MDEQVNHDKHQLAVTQMRRASTSCSFSPQRSHILVHPTAPHFRFLIVEVKTIEVIRCDVTDDLLPAGGAEGSPGVRSQLRFHGDGGPDQAEARLVFPPFSVLVSTEVIVHNASS